MFPNGFGGYFERSVMSFLVQPAAFLISQFFSYDDCGDERFSPGISDRVSLNSHVDLDSLWMVHWEDRITVETGVLGSDVLG